jgi:hypothetical protein
MTAARGGGAEVRGGRVVRSKEVDEAMLGEDAAEESGNSIGPKGEGGGKKVK